MKKEEFEKDLGEISRTSCYKIYAERRVRAELAEKKDNSNKLPRRTRLQSVDERER